ncbi:MAG TPA: primosomal protein N' [Anaerolineales bacterium]|nr:primosomal protein N' [Anaerolineales bacterium]
MPTYVEIAVNVPQVSGAFHYHLPPDLQGRAKPGHLVEIPFGKQMVQGVVLREVAQPAVPETRPVHQLLDPDVVLTQGQLALAEYLADANLASLSACISLMLPVGLSQMADTLYTLKEALLASQGIDPDQASSIQTFDELSPLQDGLVELLRRRGPLRGRQISQALPRRNWRAAARALVRRGLLFTQSVLPPPTVQPKSVRTAQLACPPELVEAELPNLARKGSQALEHRQAMMRFLMSEPGPVDVSWVYAESGGNLADLRKLAEHGLVKLGESEVWRDPLEDIDFLPSQPPPLTRDQESAWRHIKAGIEATGAGNPVPPFLLHGVTGSGKTEIYLRAVAQVIQSGKQAIILVPEIALTPQTLRRFVSRFPGRVGLMHSGLSTGERYDTWRRARQREVDIMIGPRSALFTPFPALGLIVVDESHDDSYYQSESTPCYHARRAAIAFARLVGAVCLLGSATPDISSRYQAAQGKWDYLHLPERILAHRHTVQSQMKRLALTSSSGRPPESKEVSGLGMPVSRYRPFEQQAEMIDLPPVQVVDMRRELQSGNRSIFSGALQSELSRVLRNGEQAILFLNRRGTATYVFCRDCGHSMRCPRCDTPLTYHSPRSALICHHCGYTRKMPKSCPNCGGKRVRQYGTGTEKVEAEVQRIFPQARTLRWDYETTRKKGAHDLILEHFIAHRADVLIGTQMLAKGLDLPLVTLVGVVLADVGLNLPDYRAAERTFQVLTQVSGRAGRSPLGGQVVLQTFEPDHYVIRSAAKHDYTAFYDKELEYRRQLGYPPFSKLVRLVYRHLNAGQAEVAARSLAAQIRFWLTAADRHATEMIGPVPCFFARLNGMYRWQIILRGPNPATVLRNHALRDWRVEVNPPSLL